jgi:hypothetical protein
MIGISLISCASTYDCSKGFTIPNKTITSSMNHEDKVTLVENALRFKEQCPNTTFTNK